MTCLNGEGILKQLIEKNLPEIRDGKNILRKKLHDHTLSKMYFSNASHLVWGSPWSRGQRFKSQ